MAWIKNPRAVKRTSSSLKYVSKQLGKKKKTATPIFADVFYLFYLSFQKNTTERVKQYLIHVWQKQRYTIWFRNVDWARKFKIQWLKSNYDQLILVSFVNL